MKTSKWWVIVGILTCAILVFGAVGWGQAALEVSQPIQVTSNNYYERGESIVYDGASYWMFYGRSASCTDPYDTGDPDIHDYAIYYKKATTVPGLVSATANAVPGAANCYLGETGAAVVDGKVWTFGTVPSLNFPGEKSLYGWYTTDGSSWTQVADLWDDMPNGAAHHDETGFDGKLYIMANYPESYSGWYTKWTDDPTAGTITWSTPVPLNSTSNLINGTGHFYVEGASLYIGILRTSPTKDNKVLEYSTGPEAWTELCTASSTGWDGTLFKTGTNYVYAQAPWVSPNRQYIIAWSGATPSTVLGGSSHMVAEGRYGSNNWTDMWPIGFTDAGGTSYLFYTSERDDPTAEGVGNIWYLEVDWDVTRDHYTYIQEAIDAASNGDTINVAAGTYTELIVINKSLTLRGATAGVNKNGYTVPAGYAWDDTVESIINHPSPGTGDPAVAIVDIYDVSNVTLEGFVVQELNAVGNVDDSLVRVRAQTQAISNIVVRNNVIGPFTNTTSQDGTHGRMGLCLVNNPYSGDYGIINSTFSGNKIFDAQGNGNNVFIWSSYYAYGALGPASMAGTVIEDNEIYGSRRSGIESAGGYSNLTIRNNEVYGNSSTVAGAASDDKLKYGHGILLIRGASDKLADSDHAYGPEDLTIENNEIYDNEKSGIYMGPMNTNYTITGNEIHDNGYDGIMLDLEARHWNGTFEPAPVPPDQYACYDGSTNIVANSNEIYGNAQYGVRVVGTPTNGFVFDATGNWWGDPTGPSGEGPGFGDAVSVNVDFDPWYLDWAMLNLSPGRSEVYVDAADGDDGWDGSCATHVTATTEGPKQTLQVGIDIAKPGTATAITAIHVASGAYQPIHIDKPYVDLLASSSPIVEGGHLEDETGCGVFISADFVFIGGFTIRYNDNGVIVHVGVEGTDLGGNYIYDNLHSGVFNCSEHTVNATDNWWGYASGPYHPIENPGGEGNRVSDNVDFDPWRTDPNIPTSQFVSSCDFPFDGWNLVSVPLLPMEDTPDAVFGDDVGDLTNRICRFNCAPGTYAYEDSGLTVEPEYGFWLFLNNPEIIDVAGTVTGKPYTTESFVPGPEVLDDDDIGTGVYKGWQQIGTPFNARWSDVEVKIDGEGWKSVTEAAYPEGWIEVIIYLWDAATHEYGMVEYGSEAWDNLYLHPWYGYWILNLTNSDIQFRFNYGPPPEPASYAPMGMGEASLWKPLSECPGVARPPAPPMMPQAAVIAQNIAVMVAPNPVQQGTAVEFRVTGEMASFVSSVTVQVYTIGGQLIFTDSTQGRSVTWNLRTLSGEPVANGLYLYVAQMEFIGGETAKFNKLLILK